MTNSLTTSRRDFLKKSGVIGAAMGGFSLMRGVHAAENSKSNADKKMTFAFLTDVHLNYPNENDRYNGFLQALKRVKETGAEFIIFGGDTIDICMDQEDGGQLALEKTEEMLTKFKKTMDENGLPYYLAIGNHDRYFDKNKNFTAGDEVFKKYFGHSYYSFEKKGVRFIVINSVQKPADNGNLYYFSVDNEQLEWLKKELAEIPPTTPIVAVMHVPVCSIIHPLARNNEKLGVPAAIFSNYHEVHTLFSKHRVKLVLQGHIHWYEELFAQNVRYITGGSVCAAWWRGEYCGTEEGFLLVNIDDKNQFTWEYVDYGWTAK